MAREARATIDDAPPNAAIFKALDNVLYANDFPDDHDSQNEVEDEVFRLLGTVLKGWAMEEELLSSIGLLISKGTLMFIVRGAAADDVVDEPEFWAEVREQAGDIVVRGLSDVEWSRENRDGQQIEVCATAGAAMRFGLVKLEGLKKRMDIKDHDSASKVNGSTAGHNALNTLPASAPAAGPKVRQSRKNAGAKSSGARWDSKEELFSRVMCWDTVTGEKNKRQNFSQKTRQAVFNDWRNANNFAGIRTWYSAEQHIKALKEKKKKEMYADVRAKVVAKYGEATALQIVAEATQATTDASAQEKVATDAQKRAKAEEKKRMGKERRAASKADQPKKGDVVKRPASEEPLDDPTQSSDGNARKRQKVTAKAGELDAIAGTSAAHGEEQPVGQE
ncbi:hypothetical protein LTR97_010576 [Elasticomyces elasticus]|uniref:Uncharacterized protein n=1 Tax=Elasticomyces elasticus TaxID=574655 RepID=A0AAN7VU96_9PEZI|nr:hypothetical protein LTR97_010576 [Elasticomyces elasticus]